MTRPTDFTTLSLSEKDALIAVLLERDRVLQEQMAALTARVASLEAENKTLRDKLEVPPKTPRNSSKPPSLAPKANGTGQSKAKSKVHAGAHRPLHPKPTEKRDVRLDHCPQCRADVTGVALFGGTCPCCRAKFRAPPPVGLEPGSPFGPNLRAFVHYLRYDHAVSFERLERLLFDLFALEISEGAIANMLSIPATLRALSETLA